MCVCVWYCVWVCVQCVPLEGKRFNTGGYKCECRQGYEYPFNDLAWYFDGQTMEEEYRKLKNGEPNRWDCPPYLIFLVVFYTLPGQFKDWNFTRQTFSSNGISTNNSPQDISFSSWCCFPYSPFPFCRGRECVCVCAHSSLFLWFVFSDNARWSNLSAYEYFCCCFCLQIPHTTLSHRCCSILDSQPRSGGCYGSPATCVVAAHSAVSMVTPLLPVCTST